MAIDNSALASALGISAQYKDYRNGGVLFLPQRIAVFAQGRSDVVYSSTKFTALSAADVATRMGYGCPAHHVLRQLIPANGDGVGTIPVDVYPLQDAAGSAAAVGGVAVSGTQSNASAHWLRMGGVLSQAFTIPKNASVTDGLRAIGNAVNGVLEAPFKVGYTYGSLTSAPGGSNVGNGALTGLAVAGGGVPMPGVWSLVCITAATNGGTFRLIDPSGALVAVVSLPGTALGNVAVTQGGLTFTLADGSTDFAVGDTFALTVPVTALSLTSKWKGASANGIAVELLGDTGGLVVTVTQPTGGLVNPTVDSALAQVGSSWPTMALNALNYDDTVALDTFATWGEGRWGALTHAPCVVFTGCNKSTVFDATLISSARRTDRTNAQLNSPGSVDLPFVIAARQLARIAKTANDNPPLAYNGQRATGLTPGADSLQWDYPSRDAVLKAGASTIEVVDGVVTVGDVVTFYRPSNEDPPAYRYVAHIVRLQQILFNLRVNFEGAEWRGAPLIPDDQPTVNAAAKRPKDIKARLMALADSLADNAIISDAKFTKKNTVVTINAQNPNRVDFTFPVKLSGNMSIIDATVSFGFYFGGLAAA